MPPTPPGKITREKISLISKTVDIPSSPKKSLKKQVLPSPRTATDIKTNSSYTPATSSVISTLPELRSFCQYIPVRLSPSERALLNVLESALNVSEYTDNVDVSLRRGNKARRILEGISEACNLATGLSVCGMQDGIKREDGTCYEMPSPESTSSSSRRRKQKSKETPNDTTDNDNGNDNDKSNNDSCHSLAGRDIRDNGAFFRDIFEIGRRNKVLNPSRMRDTYGKLMHLLQDAQSPSVARSLGFSLYKKLVMVGPYLEERGVGDLLNDERLVGATVCVRDRDEMSGCKLTREEVAMRVTEKKRLKDELVAEYAARHVGKYAHHENPHENPTENTNKNPNEDSDSDSNNSSYSAPTPTVTADDIRRCIDSICDALAVVESNLSPVLRMLRLLEDNFNPNNPEKNYSLQLSSSSSVLPRSNPNGYSRFGFSPFGSSSSSGAKLSHSHATQYTFVWQSLKLWCEVQKNMHKLWVCADDDLLSTSHGYQLWNTGQGLNRVQSCPKVGKVMRGLLSQTQQAAGSPWVGLSVIHLGDRDVPNALVFIDKYTQIPRFLKPLVDFIDGISDLCRDKHVAGYIENQFGTDRDLKMTVLADYFKHGFDGSGDDGGSCIDGRLTSSWNWTSRIAKKSYYHALMMSGFQGFDGDFK